jgi:hypothetical protein
MADGEGGMGWSGKELESNGQIERAMQTVS